jgi:hypothetical protein
MMISSIQIILPLLLLVVIPIRPAHGQYDDARCKCICPSPQVVSPNDTLRNLSISKVADKQRSIYIGNVDRDLCNCDGVVLSQLTPDIQGKAKEFCPWCECKYESRNTTTIKWVVTLVIAIVVILVVYMCFLIVFDPMVNGNKNRRNYEEQIDDDQTEMREPHDQDPDAASIATGSASGELQNMDEYTQFNNIIQPSPRNSISEVAADRAEVTVSIAGPAAAVATGASGVLNRAVQHTNKWKKQVQEQRKNIYDNHTMLN